MNIATKFFLTTSMVMMTVVSLAQAPSSDLAISHNRLIREKNGDGVYKLVGPYKVVGTSYLFKEKMKANLFSLEAKAYNIFLSYNTYNQEIEFYSTANPDKPLIKELGEVDSFAILPDIETSIVIPLKFIYGSLLGSTEKSYFQEVFAGKRFGIYKRYKADLGYVSSNYIQSELRQFDLECEYFYTDAEKKSIKKIKPNASSVIKEFKGVSDLSTVVSNDAFTTSAEDAFRKTFEYLNK